MASNLYGSRDEKEKVTMKHDEILLKQENEKLISDRNFLLELVFDIDQLLHNGEFYSSFNDTELEESVFNRFEKAREILSKENK